MDIVLLFWQHVSVMCCFCFTLLISNTRKDINEKMYGHRMQNVAHIYDFVKQCILRLKYVVIISVKTSKNSFVCLQSVEISIINPYVKL